MSLFFVGLALLCGFIGGKVSDHFKFPSVVRYLIAGLLLGLSFLMENLRIFNDLALSFMEILTSFTLPIYIVFFVIAGTHLQLNMLSKMGLIGLVYIICRSIGPIGGAFFGTSISKAEKAIRKYLGFGILSQAGVAIGLALLVTREFSSLGPQAKELATLVINTIAATTIIFKIIGPIATKFAITKAGEVRKDILKA